MWAVWNKSSIALFTSTEIIYNLGASSLRECRWRNTAWNFSNFLLVQQLTWISSFYVEKIVLSKEKLICSVLWKLVLPTLCSCTSLTLNTCVILIVQVSVIPLWCSFFNAVFFNPATLELFSNNSWHLMKNGDEKYFVLTYKSIMCCILYTIGSFDWLFYFS